MKLLIKISLILFYSCGIINISADDKPFVSTGHIMFYLDKADFRLSTNKSYLEFSLMVFSDQLRLVKRGSERFSIIKVETRIEDSNGEVVSKKNWITEAVFNDSLDIRRQVVYDSWGEELELGNYMVYVSVTDQETNKNGIVFSQIEIQKRAVQSIGLSSIQFINGTFAGSDENNQLKNKIPNPSRRYGLLNPSLQFYYEVYTSHGFEGIEFFTTFTISDSDGNIVKNIENVSTVISAESRGVIQALDISKLQSGIYNFKIEIRNTSNTLISSTERSFEIIQADYFSKTPFITKENSEIFEKILSYIATPEKLNNYKILSSSGKVYFLINLFRSLDPDPFTIENEYLIELFNRYHYSKEKFGWGKTEGWASERGRIFIQNGKPDDITYSSLGANTKPFEIWYYRKDREIYYIFLDLQANGRYALVHSNKEGEISNPQWKNLL